MQKFEVTNIYRKLNVYQMINNASIFLNTHIGKIKRTKQF